jgi:hypothetical protein
MMNQGVKNPSGWVVKACLAAGATPIAPTNSGALAGTPGGLSAGLSASMPFGGIQQMMGGGMQPSAGFAGGGGAASTSTGLDSGAMDMLRKLNASQQQVILSQLATSNAQNPSAWVVKACQGLVASTGGGGVVGGGASSAGGMNTDALVADAIYAAIRGKQSHTVQSSVPGVVQVPAGIQIDLQAQQLLSSVSLQEQQDILQKLTNSVNQGAVSNPSAWVAKAALKAGARSTPGMGRASPY